VSTEDCGWSVLWDLPTNRARPDEVEIGWRLACGAWGRALPTQGALVVCHLAYDAICVARLVSRTTDGNITSVRVMAKLGRCYDSHVGADAGVLGGLSCSRRRPGSRRP